MSMTVLPKAEKKDVEILAKKLEDTRFDEIFSSPMGRARQTAAPTAKMQQKEVVVLDFLKEFDALVTLPDGKTCYPWEIPLDFYAANYDKLSSEKFYENSDIFPKDFVELYKETENALFEFLRGYGFEKTVPGAFTNETELDTRIGLFCHGGKGTLILSMICGFPIIQGWNHFFFSTSSVTEINFAKSGDFYRPYLTLLGDKGKEVPIAYGT